MPHSAQSFDSVHSYGAPRVRHMLPSLAGTPRLCIERALLFTRSFARTAQAPLPLRWATALAKVLAHVRIHIHKHDLIVGRGGAEGRYGFFYPELEGIYLGEFQQKKSRGESPYYISERDMRAITEEILPFWSGSTFREKLSAHLPQSLIPLFYRDGDIYKPSFILHETATIRHSLHWILDYEKVLHRGFEGIWNEAHEKLCQLQADGLGEQDDRVIFYRSAMMVADGMRTYALRHAHMARQMAASEANPTRREELLAIADCCGHVPWKPARSFREAVQAQWFTQLASRFEQLHGGIIGNGRVDQYLYPYYRRDMENGVITREEALEILDCLWLNIARFVRIQPTEAGSLIYEGNAHYEHTCIGGLTRDGEDATNDLSWLILESDIPSLIGYPDLHVRIHHGTPEGFLHRVCERMIQGGGLPKLLNDEVIIPGLTVRGVPLEKARDYCSAGKVINTMAYFSGSTWLNLAAILEMAMYDGRCTPGGAERLGEHMGDPCLFATFEDFFQAFIRQLHRAQKNILMQQYITDMLRPESMAAPLLSSLHDLCMDQGMDVSQGVLKNAVYHGGQTAIIGLATVIDSLAAIRWLVFERKKVSMAMLMEALRTNFEGYASLRHMCANAPAYGNMDSSVDALGQRIMRVVVDTCAQHCNRFGGHPELIYVQATAHIAMGRLIGATPNGRQAGEPLSQGVSPSPGAARQGPTGVLASASSLYKGMEHAQCESTLLLNLPPNIFSGDAGVRALVALVRTWRHQRHWGLACKLIDRSYLIGMQHSPSFYGELLTRAPGFSDHFPELAEGVYNDVLHSMDAKIT